MTRSGERSVKLVVLVVALVAVVAIAGCVQGQEEDDSTQFDPEGSTGGSSGGGGGGGGGDDGGSDDGDDEPTAVEEQAAKGFDTLTAETEIRREINERREEANHQPLTRSQSLKVTSRDYSRSLRNRSGLKEQVKNETVIDLDVSADSIAKRIIKHNGYDCRKAGQMIVGQLNHVTFFNRTLRTSKDRLIRYDNEELLALGVVEDWMTHSESRDLILETGYRQIGVGIVYEESSDMVVVTVTLC